MVRCTLAAHHVLCRTHARHDVTYTEMAWTDSLIPGPKQPQRSVLGLFGSGNYSNGQMEHFRHLFQHTLAPIADAGKWGG